MYVVAVTPAVLIAVVILQLVLLYAYAAHRPGTRCSPDAIRNDSQATSRLID